MREKLARIVAEAAERERQRRALAASLREKPDLLLPEALERGLIRRVEYAPPAGRIAAVDGGLVAQEFHGLDLVLSRAAAVLFEYEDGMLAKHAYHPAAFPEPDADALGALDTHDFNLHKSLFRLKKELACASEAIAKWSPHALLLDGSLVPQLSDRPGEESELKELYREVIAAYTSLYALSVSAGCLLIGVVKDSRGKRFVELLAKALGEPVASNDTPFLHFLLEKGERTPALPLSSATAQHSILKDFGTWGGRIAVLYLKPGKEDRPLRVEFIWGAAQPDAVAALVHSLACINEKYAYPAVLIEADLRAALDRTELERIYRELVLTAGLSASALRLRRDSRPFR
ncbi:MAG: DNA double-strand break repair nuclease NurA [Candidatus Micrarchaeia archaeon]